MVQGGSMAFPRDLSLPHPVLETLRCINCLGILLDNALGYIFAGSGGSEARDGHQFSHGSVFFSHTDCHSGGLSCLTGRW